MLEIQENRTILIRKYAAVSSYFLLTFLFMSLGPYIPRMDSFFFSF